MKVAFISAGCGGLDKNIQDSHVRQSVPANFFYYSDNNFPPRRSIGPRLQAKIPKMLGWEMEPGYDVYIWADAVITLSKPNSLAWLLGQVKDHDIALFRHQDNRAGIMEELLYMEKYMAGVPGDEATQSYMNDRYKDEPMREQVQHYLSDPEFGDNKLYSGGLLVCRNNERTRKMLRDWFYECARWSIQDQLSLPYVLSKSACSVNVIDMQIYDNEYVDYYWRIDNNAHKWDGLYENVPAEPSAFIFGDTETYKYGAEFLADCATVEDWGTGAGGFKRYRPDAIGVDGSLTPHADRIANLEDYMSKSEGIFIRHVLEHNRNWKVILKNAMASATKKLALVTFVPLKEGRTEEWYSGTDRNREGGIDVRNLSLSKDDLLSVIIAGGCGKIAMKTIRSDTAYGAETVICVTK